MRTSFKIVVSLRDLSVEFRWGRKGFDDDDHPKRHVSQLWQNPETWYQIDPWSQWKWQIDWWLAIKFIAFEEGVTHTTVLAILKQDLAMRKFSTKWIQGFWSLNRGDSASTCYVTIFVNLMLIPKTLSRDMLPWMKQGVITPEAKGMLKQWKHVGFSQPKRMARIVISTSKLMTSAFREEDGIFLIDFFEKWSTVTSEYYSTLRQNLVDRHL